MSDSLRQIIRRFRSLPDIHQKRKDYLRCLASGLEYPGNDFLAEIDLIRWAELRHAYGFATDVPDCMRIIAYGAPDDRFDAQCELQSNIFHQYTLYPATVFAVPFLLRMASTPSVPDRAWIVDYLRSLAEASDHVYGRRPDDAPSVGEAVSIGLPIFRKLAASEDRDLGAAARDLIDACVETSMPKDWWRSSSWAGC